MKLGLLLPANIKYSPYIQYYIRTLDELNIDYRIMVWNKKGIHEKVDFSYNFECSDSYRKKIFVGHLFFALKCKKYITKEKIDSLVIFTIAPAYFLGVSFLKKFEKRFILDIRDDSPFRRLCGNILKKICGMADVVVVSSNKFSKWTGRNTVLCHNADAEMIKKNIDVSIKPIIEKPISIVFAGSMIEADANLRILDILGNNGDFKFGFVGSVNEQKKKIIHYAK